MFSGSTSAEFTRCNAACWVPVRGNEPAFAEEIFYSGAFPERGPRRRQPRRKAARVPAGAAALPHLRDHTVFVVNEMLK